MRPAALRLPILATLFLSAASHVAPGQISFLPAVVYPSGGTDVALGDINGDGSPDLVVASGSNPAVLTNLGDGTFGNPQVFICGNGYPQGVITADFNGDGLIDVAIASQYNGPPLIQELAIALNNGAGSFGAAQVLPLSNVPFLAAGDMTGDGRPELLIGGRVFLNDGAGIFSAGPILTTADTTIAADLDGDGDLDLCCSQSTSYPQVQLFRNLGGGLLVQAGMTPAGTQPSPYGEGPRDLIAADIDGDGDRDLIGTMHPLSSPLGTGAAVIIWRNNGNFIFQAPTLIPVGGQLRSVAAADLDANGPIDIIVADDDQSRVYVLRGLGAGNFAAPLAFASGGVAGLTAGDIEGDGDIDVVTAGQVSVLRNSRPPAAFAPYPGSGEDFFLLTGVDAIPTTGPGLTVKTARPNSLLGVRLVTPGTRFLGDPFVLAVQLFPTGAPPASPPGLPMVHVSIPGAILLVDGVGGTFPFVLTSGGFLLPIAVPPGLSGQSALFQAAVFSNLAINGLFAVSDGHEIRFVP